MTCDGEQFIVQNRTNNVKSLAEYRTTDRLNLLGDVVVSHPNQSQREGSIGIRISLVGGRKKFMKRRNGSHVALAAVCGFPEMRNLNDVILCQA